MKTYIPEYMLSAFAAQGIDVSGLVYAIHADAVDKSEYMDVYIAVSSDTMYILYGLEKVVKTSGARRIVAVYEAEKLETRPFSELGELKSELLLSTGRLCSERMALENTSVFSIGFLADRNGCLRLKNVRKEFLP